jgi:hypothetical protein
MTPLTAAQIRKFKALIEATGSQRNGERVVARIQLNAFVHKHGQDACKAAYDLLKPTKRTTRRKRQ